MKPLKVKELIKRLEKMPPDKVVEIGTPGRDYGYAVRIVQYTNTVEIQSDYEE